MFPWSAVFSLEPKVPGQRTAEELVTNTLMLELGAMVKRTERIRLERAAEGRRRRRSSTSTVDYSWLASNRTQQPYEMTPNNLLELQDLCVKIPPVKCGPLIVRYERHQCGTQIRLIILMKNKSSAAIEGFKYLISPKILLNYPIQVPPPTNSWFK